jgi:3-oxoacyl-[acyl-carrier protein] reductase
MRLKDKVAVIAGAGTGMGRTAALLFAQEGAKVAVIARRKEVVQETVNTISQQGGQAIAIAADLTERTDVKRSIEKVIEIFGTMDVLHCNTGTYATASLKEMTEEAWDQMFDANLKSGFLMIQTAAPYMIKKNTGSIILTSAIFGHFVNFKNMAHYNASKAGVISLTKSFALELAPHGIRVNCVCPGQISHQGSAGLKPNPHLLRGGLPQDVAYAVLYLASDESAWVTGTTLVVDGGLTAGIKP